MAMPVIPFRSLLFSACVLLSLAIQAAPVDYLPGNNAVPGWIQEEAPSTFTEKTLWDLMDGGAEVYVEYGVEGAASASYKHPAKGSVLVEIYAMKDAGAAYGVYSFNSRLKGNSVQIGDEALFTDYFVLVRKGAHFMTITAVSNPASTMPACLEMARAIAARIPAVAGKPEIVSRLPSLAGNSVRTVYIRGSIGLMNLYTLDASDPFRPVEGAAVLAENAQFIVIRHKDGAEAAERFRAAWVSLSSNPKYKVGESKQGEHCLVDEKGRILLFARDGDYNLMAIGLDPAVLRGLLREALEHKTAVRPRS